MFLCVFVFSETRSQSIAQAGLGFTQPSLVLNLWPSSCLNFPSGRIKGMSHDAWLNFFYQFQRKKKSSNQVDLKDFGHNIDIEHFIFLSCLIAI